MPDFTAAPGNVIHPTDGILVETNGVYVRRLISEFIQTDSLLGVGGAIVGGAQSAVFNTTTLTDASANHPIPGGILSVNSLLRVHARLKFSNVTAAPSLLVGVYHGGVAGTKLAATAATATTLTAANWPVTVEAYILVNSIGASGSMTCWGHVDLGTSLTAVTRIPFDASAIAAVGSLDTTTTKNITIGVQWSGGSAPSASDTITCVGSLVQAVNF